MQKVYLGSNIKAIPKNTFYGCTSLEKLNSDTNINLSGITSLGDFAFYGCTSIKEVYINQSLQASKIERGVFVSSSAGISSFDEIVVRVMKASGRVSISESEMYTMLVLSGIIKNSIPNELRESKFFIFKDGVYTIKESV